MWDSPVREECGCVTARAEHTSVAAGVKTTIVWEASIPTSQAEDKHLPFDFTVTVWKQQAVTTQDSAPDTFTI